MTPTKATPPACHLENERATAHGIMPYDGNLDVTMYPKNCMRVRIVCYAVKKREEWE